MRLAGVLGCSVGMGCWAGLDAPPADDLVLTEAKVPLPSEMPRDSYRCLALRPARV